MLLPVGFLLPGISTKLNSWKKIVALCTLFAICLETAQLITGTGDFQIDDLWSNTFSALVGYWLRRLLIKGEK
jgi:glycopeptide antibiotics resistance protein